MIRSGASPTVATGTCDVMRPQPSGVPDRTIAPLRTERRLVILASSDTPSSFNSPTTAAAFRSAEMTTFVRSTPGPSHTSGHSIPTGRSMAETRIVPSMPRRRNTSRSRISLPPRCTLSPAEPLLCGTTTSWKSGSSRRTLNRYVRRGSACSPPLRFRMAIR